MPTSTHMQPDTKHQSIRLFENDLLERLSHVHPITPLVMWAPPSYPADLPLKANWPVIGGLLPPMVRGMAYPFWVKSSASTRTEAAPLMLLRISPASQRVVPSSSNQ